jgi:Uma2 family endonuclease
MAQLLTESELDFYPSSDGEPLAETPIHVEAIVLLHQALQDFFKDRPEVFIASDIFWYWEEGNPKARISPDVMVVPGVSKRELYERRSYFSWIEGVVPAAVFEMASRRTWKKDVGSKFETYEKLGVKEYFIFDPEFRYLEAPLLGYRLQGKKYRPISGGTLESLLGFHLEVDHWTIRLIDSRTKEPILSRSEAIEKANANAREERRVAAVERKRAEAETGRAEAEKRRAELEKLLHESEKQRADLLAAEVERLKKELGRSGS